MMMTKSPVKTNVACFYPFFFLYHFFILKYTSLTVSHLLVN